MSRNIVNLAATISVVSVAACGALVALAACSSNSGTTAGTGGSSGSVTPATASHSVAATTGAGTPTASVTSTTTGTPTATVGSGGSAATTTTAGSGGGGTSLDPSSTGYVQDTALGVTGAWYAYGDEVGSTGTPGMGNCEVTGMHPDSACSTITSPTLPATATGFPPDATGAMCLVGNAAVVPMSVAPATGPDYSNVFGIGIGLDFNNIKSVKNPWDSTKAMPSAVVGFSFNITGVTAIIAAGGSVRVEFPTTQTDAAGNDSWTFSPSADGAQTVHFAGCAMGATGACDLSPAFTPPAGTTQPPFDPTMIESIQFHVPTNTTAAVPVAGLCVSGLTPLFN